MSDTTTTYQLGAMVWTVADDEDAAPAPMCMAARAEMLATWQADLAAHRQWVKRNRVTREEIWRRADAVYDAAAKHARANGLHMM